MTLHWKFAPLAALVSLAACATSTTERLRLPPLKTVERVELDRYTGTWYEIASFPQSFQRGCTATSATYTARADGEIDVVNRCRKGRPRRRGEVGEGSGPGRRPVEQRAARGELLQALLG